MTILAFAVAYILIAVLFIRLGKFTKDVDEELVEMWKQQMYEKGVKK